MYPYGKQYTDMNDINSIISLFQNNQYLTCGNQVSLFEKDVCDFISCKHAVAVNSCTSALHMYGNWYI